MRERARSRRRERLGILSECVDKDVRLEKLQVGVHGTPTEVRAAGMENPARLKPTDTYTERDICTERDMYKYI